MVEIKNSIISIKSNCVFFRPTIFSYKGKYLDVHISYNSMFWFTCFLEMIFRIIRKK